MKPQLRRAHGRPVRSACRPLLRAGALAVLPLALAACSSGGGGTSSPVAAAPTTASATVSAAPDPGAGLLDGTRLKAALLPGSVLPSGYRADAQGTVDSGPGFAAPSSAAVDPVTGCQKLEASAWIQTSGIGGAAFAQGDFTNAEHEEFNEEADSFRGTGAETVMTRLQQVFAHCAHFTDTSTSSVAASVRVRTSRVKGRTGPALVAVMSAPQWDGGTTLVATRVGNVVVTTFYNVQSSDMGAAGLALTERIAARVKAEER